MLTLAGNALTLSGALINIGTLRLIGTEAISVGNFMDYGTTQYYGSGSYAINTSWTYNNLQLSNGTFTFSGPSLLAKNNIIMDNRTLLNLPGNDTTLVADSDADGRGAFLMSATAAISGDSTHALEIYAGQASTLGAISNVTGLTFGRQGTSTPTYTAGASISAVSLTNDASTIFRVH